METTDYKLGEILEITSGGTPNRAIAQYYEGGTIPWVKTGDLKTKYVTSTPENITEYGLQNSSAKIFPVNTVLVALYGATIGATSILGIEAATNQACAALLPSAQVHAEYLYYFLRSIKRELVSKGQGGGQPNISGKILKNTRIKLPPLDDQIRIVNLLSKAENLIRQRERSIELLDEFLKMKFVEMFGDNRTNPKGYDKDSLDNLVAPDCPLTYGIVQPGDEMLDGTPVVRPVDLSTKYVGIKGLKKIDPRISSNFKRTVLRGDEILLCVRGTTGVLSIAKSELKGSNVTRGITPIWFEDDNVLTQFAFYLLRSEAVQHEIEKYTYGIALKQINLSEVRKLQLIKPPLGEQTLFDQVALRLDAMKNYFELSLNGLTDLYNSLSMLALTGNLELVKESSIEGETKTSPELKEEAILNKINKQLENFHRNLPHTGAPSDIDNTIRQLEAELKIRGVIPFWGEFVRYRIVKDKFKESFTFDQLWNELVKFPFENMPEYDEVANLLFKWLSEENAFIRQQFNESTKQIELVLNETAPA